MAKFRGKIVRACWSDVLSDFDKGREMGLFLMLLWDGAMVHGSGSDAFSTNSRLGRREFPISPATGIDWQGFDLDCGLRSGSADLAAKSIEFPARREKPGI